MSRPTIFKAIDKLGRRETIKWAMASSPDHNVLNGLDATEDIVRPQTLQDIIRRQKDTKTVENNEHANDNGVLDLRTQHGSPRRACSLDETNNPEPTNGEHRISSPQNMMDSHMVDTQRRHGSNLSKAEHPLDAEYEMTEKREYLPADSTATLSPPRHPGIRSRSLDQQEYDMVGRRTPFHHHPYDDVFNKPVTSRFEPVSLRQEMRPTLASLPTLSENMWPNDIFTNSPRENHYNMFPNYTTHSNPQSPLKPIPVTMRNYLDNFNVDIHCTGGKTQAFQPALLSMYSNHESFNEHSSTMPPVHSQKSAKNSHLRSFRTNPYEAKQSSYTKVCREDSSVLHQRKDDNDEERRKTVDNGLAVVIQDVISWMQSICQRMDMLEQQVQFFKETTNNQSSPSAVSSTEDTSSSPASSSAYFGGDLRSYLQEDVPVPLLNTPESDALIGEVVNDCHWDQWKPFAGAPRLAIKLAKDCVFGTRVLLESTVTGRSCKNALSKKGLDKIKECLKDKYGERCSDMEFEMVWKQSRESISQLCKRLRRKCVPGKPEATEGSRPSSVDQPNTDQQQNAC